MSDEAPEIVAEAETDSAPDVKALTLEERIAYLEAQNEGLKRVGGLALVLLLLLGGLFVHQTHSDMKSVSSQGYTVLDQGNLLVGAITPDAQGRIQFLQARYGELRSPAELPQGFSGFAFYDLDGRPRLLLGEDANRNSVFLVTDPERGVAFDPFAKVPPKASSPAGAPPISPSPAPATPGASPSPL